MALSNSSILREDDTTGTSIGSKVSGGGVEYQAVVIVDDNEACLGDASNPLKAQLTTGVGAEAGTQASPLIHRHVALTWTTSGGSLSAQSTMAPSARTIHELRAIVDPSVTTPRYLHVFDSPGAVSNGATPVWIAYIPPGGEASESLPGGLVTATGVVLAVSTTLATLTLPGGPEAIFMMGVI